MLHRGPTRRGARRVHSPGWESYGEYLSAVEKLGGFAVNVTGMVGHNMLRTYVMGEAAWDRPASEEERARCARTCSGWPT